MKATRDSHYLAAIDRLTCAIEDLERVPALLRAIGLPDGAEPFAQTLARLETTRHALLQLRATEPQPEQVIEVRESHGARRG